MNKGSISSPNLLTLPTLKKPEFIYNLYKYAFLRHNMRLKTISKRGEAVLGRLYTVLQV